METCQKVVKKMDAFEKMKLFLHGSTPQRPVAGRRAHPSQSPAAGDACKHATKLRSESTLI
jgi:hypothetical protein